MLEGKLHPPYIDGKVPAFCGTVLKVPFRHNRAVSFNTQNLTMSCKLTTVSTNEWVTTMTSNLVKIDTKTGLWYAEFDLNIIDESTGKSYLSALIVGLYYKIQIAYIDSNGKIGYYSDVGVTKYTSKPTVVIRNLDEQGFNLNTTGYVGSYSQSGEERDSAEKEYSYCFTMYNPDKTIFYTTNEQIHNSSTDIYPYESSDTFVCNKVLKTGIVYTLQYKVTTINGLEVYSQEYRIRKKDTVRPSIDADLHAIVDFENGYIRVYMTDKNSEKGASGDFKICRTCSKDNFETWDEMCSFSLNNETVERELFKDFTIEQGYQYQYSIQQFNSRGLHSNKILSEIVTADFEDMFLYDGERQLKVRFNPNVSTFKNDIQESKIETIGGRYPFIFRNGNIKYKEFPIGGLISYHLDEQFLFLNEEELGPMEFRDTDLTSENLRAERIFKLKVLEWLNNGEPKLFRSPTEGNYLVRLLNVSLSPNPTVGRMLHSFTATAYEIDDIDFTKLKNLGMFKGLEFETSVMSFRTVELKNVIPYLEEIPEGQTMQEALGGITLDKLKNEKFETDDGTYRCIMTPETGIYCFRIENMTPGSIIAVSYSNSATSKLEFIEIGDTTTYMIDVPDEIYAVYAVYSSANIVKNAKLNAENVSHKICDGKATYGYYTIRETSNFDEIADFEEEMHLAQFIGPMDNVVANLEDIRTSITYFYKIKIVTRPIIEVNIYRDVNNFYRMYMRNDYSHDVPLKEKDILPFAIYKDCAAQPNLYYSGKDIIKICMGNRVDTYRTSTNQLNFNNIYKSIGSFWNDQDIETQHMYQFYFNHPDYSIDLEAVGYYEFTNMENVSVFALGNMLMADCLFNSTITVYSVEERPGTIGKQIANAKAACYNDKLQYDEFYENIENFIDPNTGYVNSDFITGINNFSGWKRQGGELYAYYISLLNSYVNPQS